MVLTSVRLYLIRKAIGNALLTPVLIETSGKELNRDYHSG